MSLIFEQVMKTLAAFDVDLSATEMIRLTDKLVELSRESERPEKLPKPTAAEMRNVASQLDTFQDFVKAGQKVQAIKVLRGYFTDSGSFDTPGLRETKEVVDEFFAPVGKDPEIALNRRDSSEGR